MTGRDGTIYRLFVTRQLGETLAHRMRWFADLGLPDESAVQAVYGASGRWHSLALRPATYGLEREILRAARVPDIERGFALDEAQLPAARTEALVQWWDLVDERGAPQPVGRDGFLALPARVRGAVEAICRDHLYGRMGDGFFERLERQAVALLGERGGGGPSLRWDDLHEAVIEWLHWRLGWPLRYRCIAEAPVDVGMGLMHLLRWDAVCGEARTGSGEREFEEMRRLAARSGFVAL